MHSCSNTTKTDKIMNNLIFIKGFFTKGRYVVECTRTDTVARTYNICKRYFNVMWDDKDFP